MVVVQSFTYRDEAEEFSNKYHFAGPAPGDDASWKALADALIGHLRPMFTPVVTFVRAYGYNDGDHPSVWGHDYTIPGPPLAGNWGGDAQAQKPAGDQAAFIRWPTTKRNSRGKIVYARKYFHDMYVGLTTPDRVSASQYALMQTFANACIDGSISSVFHLCLPDGTPALAGGPDTWITTRTLKRRGKRPPT
jgi:hypothetical protein